MGLRVTRRGTTNRNARGGSVDRRRRREWLVATFGDGVTVACTFCPAVLTVDTVSADRIVPGCDGGTYRRGNIRPACLPCNSATGGKLGAQRLATRRVTSAFGEKCDSVAIYPGTTEPEETEMANVEIRTQTQVHPHGLFIHAADILAETMTRTKASLYTEVKERLDGDGITGLSKLRKFELAAMIADWDTSTRDNERDLAQRDEARKAEMVGTEVRRVADGATGTVTGYNDHGIVVRMDATTAAPEAEVLGTVFAFEPLHRTRVTAEKPKPTATQKLARLQASAAKSGPCCSLWSRGIDCMCADAAEFDVDTEELVDDVDRDCDNPDHSHALPGHRHCKHGITRDCPNPDDCDLIDAAPVVVDSHAHYIAARLLGGVELHRVEGTSLVRGAMIQHGAPAPATVIWLTPVSDALVPLRPAFPVAVTRFCRGDIVALCAHAYTVRDSCPNCDAAEELDAPTPYLRAEMLRRMDGEQFAPDRAQTLSLAEYLTKTGTTMLRRDARAARC